MQQVFGGPVGMGGSGKYGLGGDGVGWFFEPLEPLEPFPFEPLEPFSFEPFDLAIYVCTTWLYTIFQQVVLPSELRVKLQHRFFWPRDLHMCASSKLEGLEVIA